jgi:hypothetical protein
MTGGIITLAVLVIAIPFAALADWFKFIKELPPGQQELAKASHGAGMLALVIYGGFFHFFAAGLRHELGKLVYWIPVAVAAWGLGWFLLNARFAALAIGPPHRGTIIARALIKIALGCAAWVYAAHLDLSWAELALRTVAVWCVTTGGVKFLLMVCGGGRGEAYPMVARDIEANEFRWD